LLSAIRSAAAASAGWLTGALGQPAADDAFLSIQHFYLLKKHPGTHVTMSFGFSVGDFLAVIQLANKIRKDFASAPSEFKGALDV
jgi:hypothetical protein